MPKSFLVKKTSRNKRKLEEDLCDGKYLFPAIHGPADKLVKGQLPSCRSFKKQTYYKIDKIIVQFCGSMLSFANLSNFICSSQSNLI